MSIILFLKVFSDLCLSYSILGSFPTLFPQEFSFLWPAVLGSVSVAAASVLYQHGRDKLRYLCILIPTLLFFLCESIAAGLSIVPAVIYTAAITIRGNFALEYYSFQSAFRKGLICFGIYFVVILSLAFFESSVPSGAPVLDFQSASFYGILHAFSGVMVQRQLRLGTENTTGEMSKKRTVLSVFAIAACVAVMVGIEQMLREGTDSLLESFYSVFTVLIASISWFLSMLFEKADPEFKEDFLEGLAPTEPQYTTPFPTHTGSQKPDLDPVQAGFPWWLVILMVVIVVVILLMMLRNFFLQGSYVDARATEEKVEAEKRDKKQNKRSNRNKIRHYYRQYLKAERKKGLRLRENQTSFDILLATSPTTDPDAAQALREEYLHARYNLNSEITQEQVDRAKAALKKTRGGT